MTDIKDFMELVRQRSSVRRYSERPVEREKIELLLESARLAPSAVNFQPWKFIVITSTEGKEALCQSYTNDWFRTASVYIVACGNHAVSWHRRFDTKDHCDIDVAIAVEHICLCAAAQGLGTCWVCNFDPVKLGEYLALPEGWEPVAIIPVGYPEGDGAVRPKNRKTIEDVVEWIED